MILRRFPARSPDDLGGGAEPVSTSPAPVPYERFAEKVAEAKSASEAAAVAKSEAEAARAQLAPLTTARDAWASEKATLEKSLADTQRRFGLARVGVAEDDHVAALALAYQALPAEGRPATEAELWGDIVAGKVAPPRALVGFLPAQPAAAAAAAAITRPTTLPAGTATPAGTQATISAADVQKLNRAWQADPRNPEKRAAAQAGAAELRRVMGMSRP